MHVKANRGWLVLANIPFRGEMIPEPLHLKDTRDNRRVAEAKRRRVEAAILTGAFNYTEEFPSSSRFERLGLRSAVILSLGDFALEWLAENANLLSPSTAQHYGVTLKNHLLPHSIAAKRISEVSDGDVKKLIGEIQAKFVDSRWDGTRAINMLLARLRTIFATAKRRKLITDDPMPFVKNLRQPKPDVDPFDLDEALALIETGEGWERPFAAVLLFAGLRPNEALALRWEQIDWSHNLIRVRYSIKRNLAAGLPKTPRSEREVEMIGPVRDELKLQRARSELKGGLVFPSREGTPIDLNNFRSRYWPRMLRRARVRPRTIYQCRHSFARFLLEHGEDTPQHVADQLGHASVRMVFEVYGRWMRRPASRAAAALERAVGERYKAAGSVTLASPSFGGEKAGNAGKGR